MKELVSVIILFSFLRLGSYGIWNLRDKNNITGAVGVCILCIGIIFMLATVIIDMA